MTWLRRLFASHSVTRSGTVRRARLNLESLESRLVPTVTYHGGPLLSHVEVQGVYLGSDWASNSTLQQQKANFEKYLADIVNSGYVDMLSNAGYGVGRGSATTGLIDSTSINKSQFLTDVQIQAMLQADLSQGKLAAPDANRLYVVFVEANVVVALGTHSNSTNSFLGYHSWFYGKTANGSAQMHYSVICYPGGSVGNVSIGSQYTAFQDMTTVASHEIAESITDPNPGSGWYDDQRHGEIGDLANTTIITYHGYTVQAEVNQNDQLIYPTDNNPGDGALYAVAVFPGGGVKRYSSTRGWQQLSSRDASAVGVDENGDVLAEFPGSGLFRYEDSTGWQQLTPANASAIAIAGNSNVVAEFSGAGVYRFEDGTGWKWLTPADAASVAIDARGDVAADFHGSGVYRFEDGTGWQRLTSADASTIAIAGNGNVAASFQGAGVYRFEDSTGWTWLTSASADFVSINAAGDVAASFQASGGYRFQDGTGWQHVSRSPVTQISISGNGDMLGEFSGAGVWLYHGAPGWQRLTAADAALISFAEK